MTISFPVRYEPDTYCIVDADDVVLAVVSSNVVQRGDATDVGEEMAEHMNNWHDHASKDYYGPMMSIDDVYRNANDMDMPLIEEQAEAIWDEVVPEIKHATDVAYCNDIIRREIEAYFENDDHV